jgi:hypothetical protein
MSSTTSWADICEAELANKEAIEAEHHDLAEAEKLTDEDVKELKDLVTEIRADLALPEAEQSKLFGDWCGCSGLKNPEEKCPNICGECEGCEDTEEEDPCESTLAQPPSESVENVECCSVGTCSIVSVREEVKEEGASESVESESCSKSTEEMRQRLERLRKKDVITLAEVQECPNVRLTDQDENLSIYCYDEEEENDQSLINGLAGKCRGIIFDTKTGALVSQAFGYTPMYVASEDKEEGPLLPNDLKEFIRDNFDLCSFKLSLEGTLVRVLNHSGKWYVTTHRKLSADKSMWGTNVPFGDQFREGLSQIFNDEPDKTYDRLFSHLDPKKQYLYFIQASINNRIVVSMNPKHKVWHVATFENGVEVLDNNNPIPSQTQIAIPSPNHLNEFVKMFSYMMEQHLCAQGLICFLPNGTQVKLVDPLYYHFFKLRGNEPSIMFRYLQLRGTENQNEFMMMYPNKAAEFGKYEGILTATASIIYNAYLQRYVYKNYTQVPPEEFQILKQVHGIYCQQQGTRTPVSLELVTNCMNNSDPTLLNKIIRRYKENESKMKKIVGSGAAVYGTKTIEKKE